MDLMRIFARIAFSEADVPLDIESDSKKALTDFVNAGRRLYPELSDDRLKTLFGLCRDSWQKREGRSNIFHMVLTLAETMLTTDNGHPKVIHRHLLRWNELSAVLDSELFVCALLAWENLHRPDTFMPDLHWPHVLNCDHPELNGLYRQMQLVEGHSHLKASADVFDISWICLMNHCRDRRKQFNKVEHEHNSPDGILYRCYLDAARCRLRLFQSCGCGELSDSFTNAVNGMPWELDNGDDIDTELQRLRCWDAKGSIYDYASPRPDPVADDSASDPTDIFTGERTLLYKALRRIFIDGDREITNCLYKYILAKNRIRMAMIQINSNMGFGNFARFEKIKDIFIDHDKYKKYGRLLKSLPVSTAAAYHFVKRMETRVTPKNTARQLLTDLLKTESLIRTGLPSDCSYALICHFIKSADETPVRSICGVAESERDHRLREKVRQQAIAIHGAAPRLPMLVGIDAAASELDARPEVFAQAFRYLRQCGLHFTYHAGEDYYDIADGLRTIDEVVSMTGMHGGDRIGHGTALGIDSARFYEACHHSIAMPKQILLDNIAWLLCRSLELGIGLDDSLRHRLRQRFDSLYAEIFGNSKISPDIYFMSMCLRGDDPSSYTGECLRKINPIDTIDSWVRYSLNQSSDHDLVQYRADKEVYDLYKRYHYDAGVRQRGAEITEFDVSPSYASLIGRMQEGIMSMLAKIRIAVECCPTSNLRISRLGRYDYHPVIALSDPSATLRPAVTVNTDDLGIFCTSLDNEYNLIAAAMYKQKTPAGEARFTSDEILSRIKKLIENGWNYAFPSVHR